MMFSRNLSLSLLLALTLSSSACFKSKNKPADELTAQNSATFIVEEVSGSSVVTKTQKDWDVPIEKLYNFKVCVKHLHTRESIQGHKFAVLDSRNNPLPEVKNEIRSNNDGCITWHETIKFDYLADAKYIALTRYIKANGIHSGQRVIKMAINPWSKGKDVPEVVDLSRQKVSANQIIENENEALHYLNAKSADKKKRVWVDGMIINISSQGVTDTKSNATIKLDISPKLLRSDINGNPEISAIYQGRFTAKVYIISIIKEGDRTVKTLLGMGEQKDPQSMIGDRVRFDIPLSLSFKSSMGQLEMALVLTPENGPDRLSPFEGVFFLGSYKTQIGFIGYTIKNDLKNIDRNFSVENYMKNNVRKPNPLDLPNGIFGVQPFEFDYIEFLFGQVEIEKETPTSRTISILMQTVVRNPMENNEPVRSADFMITLWDGKKIPARTNQVGILAWRDKITYKTYSPPHYILKNVTFTNQTSGFSETIPIRLNPWALFGYALGYDVRRPDPASEEKLLIDATHLIPSQMYMGKYVLAINENINYVFQKDLSVEPYKSFIINLAPKILNYSHPINGIESSYPFRDGSYLLKVGIVTDLKEQKYISTAKKIVKVREGQINEDIRLKFPDLRQMRVKSQLYVEIHPLDYTKLSPYLLAVKGRGDVSTHFINDDPAALEEINKAYPNLDDLIEKDSGIENRTFLGMFTPFSNKAEGPLRPTDDLDERIKSDPTILKSLHEDGLKKFTVPGEATRFFSRMKFTGSKDIDVEQIEKEEKAMLLAEKARVEKLLDRRLFVEYANANYINLTSGTAKNSLLTGLNSSNTILGDINSLYRTFNAEKYKVEEKELWDILPDISNKNGKIAINKSLPRLLATRLCDYWIRTLHRFDNSAPPFGRDTGLNVNKCVKDTQDKSIDELFVLDQKMMVSDFEQVGDMDNGYYLRLNVSSDYRVGFGHSFNQSSSWSFSPLSIFNPFKILNFLVNFSGLSYTLHNESESFDTGDSKSSGLGASTSISGEQGTFLLKLKSYERCSIIRMNPSYINELRLLEKFTAKLSEEEKVKQLSRGVMICSGIIDNKPVLVPESVHYYTPDPFDGSMIEITDNRNYPWVVGFRGQRDYTQLMNVFKADGIMHARKYDDLKNGINRPQSIDANRQPIGYIDKSIKDFKRSSGGIVTTYPGVYTIP